MAAVWTTTDDCQEKKEKRALPIPVECVRRFRGKREEEENSSLLVVTWRPFWGLGSGFACLPRRPQGVSRRTIRRHLKLAVGDHH